MKKGYFTKLDPGLRETMRRFKAETGVPEAQQIDRGVREWLAARGYLAKELKGGSRKAKKR